MNELHIVENNYNNQVCKIVRACCGNDQTDEECCELLSAYMHFSQTRSRKVEVGDIARHKPLVQRILCIGELPTQKEHTAITAALNKMIERISALGDPHDTATDPFNQARVDVQQLGEYWNAQPPEKKLTLEDRLKATANRNGTSVTHILHELKQPADLVEKGKLYTLGKLTFDELTNRIGPVDPVEKSIIEMQWQLAQPVQPELKGRGKGRG